MGNAFKITSVLAFTGLILMMQFATAWIYHIEYHKLSFSITYGRTEYLLPNLLSITSIAFLLLMGGLLLLLRYSGNSLLFNVMLLLTANMIMFSVLSFLSQGYVVGDQPRAEFALGSMIVEGRISLGEAERISGYFHWPGLWIYEGIFSAITNTSPFDAPVLIMVVVWLLLGLALATIVKYVYGKANFTLAIEAFLLYAILNPYKIIHLCPQIYALSLLIIITSLLFKGLSISNNFVLLLLSTAVIVSHPLTSIIVVGILLFILMRNLLTRFFKGINRAVNLYEASVITVLMFFILWNIRFNDLIQNIVAELTGGISMQLLAPIAGVTLYSVDSFYRAMELFRYISIFVMLFLALLTLFLRRADRRIKGIFSLIIAISLSSLLLNLIPGSFFHRVFYYTTPFITILSAGSFKILKKLAVKSKTLIKVFSMFIIIVLPLLSQLSSAEFITNNDPLATLNSPFEFSIDKFVSNFYTHLDYSWTVSSGSISYYTILAQKNLLDVTLSPSNSLMATYLFTYLNEKNITAVEKYTKIVYPTHFFIVSPREKYVFYERTVFTDFYIIDRYLDAKNVKIYDNGLFRLYEALK
ncbi:MAG: hypothetical protein QXW86_12120 [Saccharolobus sp.]|uniref:hypothetical protein n=1 Tax=Saccharolobus sp. TaxID=2100761 RepID=UPI00316F0413